jgi:glycosyltransferase involved in cell wall biosynthesis
MKKVLLLVIDNLAKGGAEVLLAGTLSELNKKYSIILVTLTNECEFNTDEILFEKKYTLGFDNKLSIFSCVRKLKKIIKETRPSLIHSHLFYSSLIARRACPSKIPLVYSLHNEMSKNVFNNSKVLTYLEKRTIKKNHSVIAVSKGALTDYENTIEKNNSSFVLHNYISDAFFRENLVKTYPKPIQKINLIAVGNIKTQKNYVYLIKAFSLLKEFNVNLDIYGYGKKEMIKSFQNEIDKNNLAINFKGQAHHIHELLPQYDLYVSSSKHEGFGIATVEAMASGLPVLLSDLPVYHEITFSNALFFDIQDPMSFKILIKKIFEDKYDLNKLSKKGIDIAKEYTKEIYLKKLFKIYNQLLNISNQDQEN